MNESQWIPGMNKIIIKTWNKGKIQKSYTLTIEIRYRYALHRFHLAELWRIPTALTSAFTTHGRTFKSVFRKSTLHSDCQLSLYIYCLSLADLVQETFLSEFPPFFLPSRYLTQVSLVHRQERTCNILWLTHRLALEWKSHSLNIQRKIVQTDKILSDIHNNLLTHQPSGSTYSFVYPHLKYSNTIWSDNHKTSINKSCCCGPQASNQTNGRCTFSCSNFIYKQWNGNFPTMN